MDQVRDFGDVESDVHLVQVGTVEELGVVQRTAARHVMEVADPKPVDRDRVSDHVCAVVSVQTGMADRTLQDPGFDQSLDCENQLLRGAGPVCATVTCLTNWNAEGKMNRQLFAGQGEPCAVCFETPQDVQLIPCGHASCHSCLKKLKNCPLCRTKIEHVLMLNNRQQGKTATRALLLRDARGRKPAEYDYDFEDDEELEEEDDEPTLPGRRRHRANEWFQDLLERSTVVPAARPRPRPQSQAQNVQRHRRQQPRLPLPTGPFQPNPSGIVWHDPKTEIILPGCVYPTKRMVTAYLRSIGCSDYTVRKGEASWGGKGKTGYICHHIVHS